MPHAKRDLFLQRLSAHVALLAGPRHPLDSRDRSGCAARLARTCAGGVGMSRRRRRTLKVGRPGAAAFGKGKAVKLGLVAS
jgi:hypothetical protein